jgi:hypothetical protein
LSWIDTLQLQPSLLLSNGVSWLNTTCLDKVTTSSDASYHTNQDLELFSSNLHNRLNGRGSRADVSGDQAWSRARSRSRDTKFLVFILLSEGRRAKRFEGSIRISESIQANLLFWERVSYEGTGTVMGVLRHIPPLTPTHAMSRVPSSMGTSLHCFELFGIRG